MAQKIDIDLLRTALRQSRGVADTEALLIKSGVLAEKHAQRGPATHVRVVVTYRLPIGAADPTVGDVASGLVDLVDSNEICDGASCYVLDVQAISPVVFEEAWTVNVHNSTKKLKAPKA